MSLIRVLEEGLLNSYSTVEKVNLETFQRLIRHRLLGEGEGHCFPPDCSLMGCVHLGLHIYVRAGNQTPKHVELGCPEMWGN